MQVKDSNFEDDSNESLNNRVIQESAELSQLIEANLHLVNAYPRTPEHIAIEIPNFDSVAYNHEIEKHHKDAMLTLADEYNIKHSNVHVITGTPEDVISDVVSEVDAELVILGAPSRSGISAFLIGNTAEMVIDSINCDLLALK